MQLNGLPVLQNINNSATWMPVKVGGVDRSSAFALQRMAQPELTNKSVVAHRFIGGNRDASSVVARKRLQRGDVRSLTNSYAASDAVSKRDVTMAIARTRRGSG
jgi:hypothetical protein